MWSELKSKWMGEKMKNELRFYINQIRKKKIECQGKRSRWPSGGHWIYLPPWAQQKYIYTWNSSHQRLTGDWQKDSSISKAVRKIHMESDRRIEKWSVRDLCLWEGTQRKREITQEDSHPGGEGWSTYRVPQHWCLTLEGESLWLVGGQAGLIGGLWEVWILLMRRKHTCLFLK